MRNGKNPNYKQKRLLKSNKKDWTEWLFIGMIHKDGIDAFRFRHKKTNEVIEL